MGTTKGISRRNFIAAGALAAAAGARVFMPRFAYGDPLLETQEELEAIAEQIVEARLEVEGKTDTYYKAQEEYLAAKNEVDESKRIIAQNDKEIDGLQDRLSDSMKAHYRSNSLGLIDVVMGSTSFADLVTRWEQYDRLTEAEAALIAKAKDLKERNEAEKVELEKREKTAREKSDECNELRKQAKARLDELEKLQSELDEEYAGILEEVMGAALAEALRNIQIKFTGPNGLDPAGAVVEYAKSRLGCPYIWAAEGPTAFDCSGLVMWCFAQVGIGVPHYTESQYALALSRGAVLAMKDVKPGDVLYRPGHVGIAVEDGGTTYIHAPQTGDVVRYADWPQFVCGLRFAGEVNKTVDEAKADAEAQPKEDETSAKEKERQEAKKREAEQKAEEKRQAEEAKRLEEQRKAEEEAARKQAEQQAQQQAEQQAAETPSNNESASEPTPEPNKKTSSESSAKDPASSSESSSSTKAD